MRPLRLSVYPRVGTVRAFSGVRPPACPARFHHLICPLLTSAPRSGALASPSVPMDTMQISRGKLDRLHRTPAESTAWACSGYGTSRIRARSSNPDCLIFGSCPSGRGFASALPSDGTSRSPPLRLASPLSPPDLGRGLAPPSCQACPAHPEPWTHKPRPPLLGKPKERVSHSYHRPSS